METLMAGPQEVSELKSGSVHHQRENVDDWPREVSELKVRERPPPT
jgi:hypothetical protein